MLSSSCDVHIFFPILTKCEFSGHILLQTLLNIKCNVNPSSRFRVPWDGKMEGGIESRTDERTDMGKRTVIFATLQTLLKLHFVNFYFFNYALCEIRIILGEQQMARGHFTHLHIFVNRFTNMQYLTCSAIRNLLHSNFIGISWQ
jgi:hypothetical protein